MYRLSAVLSVAVCASVLLCTQWDMEKSLCQDMRPPALCCGPPQPSPSPYYIKMFWTQRSVIFIFVYGFYKHNNTIRGVLIQVRANATPIGTFSRFNKVMATLNCPPGKRNMVYNASKQKQLATMAVWRPPLEFYIMDNIAVYVTVIKRKGIYWHMKQKLPVADYKMTTEYWPSDIMYVLDFKGHSTPLMFDSQTIKSDYYH